MRVVRLGWLLASLLAGAAAQADELGTRPPSWEPRVPLGKSPSPTGRLLANENPGRPWQAVGEKDDVFSRDLLLALPGIRAGLETTTGVELTLWGNLPELANYSGLQSGVILHDSRTFDLDFTLRRGRVIISNRKDKGPARVWVRVDGGAFQLTLGEPGSAICLALYSFWPRGVPFSPTPKPDEEPARTLNILVVKGQVDVKTGGTQHSLSAPPGAAYFHWDSANGPEPGVRRRDELPDWANPDAAPPPAAKALLAAAAAYEGLVKDKDPRTALFDLLAAAENERAGQQGKAVAEFAVFGLAALNDIDRVMQALGDPRRPQARKTAVSALRHWIGDAPGRDQRLYQYLPEHLGFTKAQAATVLHLLHSDFPPEEPDTYETLIAYLRHEKLAVRELAWWQLSHLVSPNVAVPYDPAGSDAERTQAYKAWKELIPSGKLPPSRPKRK
jgi:hypothetical protein